MIVLDFAPGHHGHFLEFVVNKYIFDVPSSVDNIFQISGSCHNINTDRVYQDAKIVSLDHSSSLRGSFPTEPEKVIFVRHNSRFDFVLLVNVYNRAVVHRNGEEFSVSDINKIHMSLMSAEYNNDWQLRNDWYTKLSERHFDLYERKLKSDAPVFDFNFGCFFDLNEFVSELQRLSNFVGLTLKFDQTLTTLWEEFIKRNQGYNLFVKCNQILAKTLNNQTFEIDLDWQGQSYINHQLSKMFRLYDGPLFDDTPYPKTTQELYQIIIDHLDNFDKRF